MEDSSVNHEDFEWIVDTNERQKSTYQNNFIDETLIKTVTKTKGKVIEDLY